MSRAPGAEGVAVDHHQEAVPEGDALLHVVLAPVPRLHLPADLRLALRDRRPRTGQTAPAHLGLLSGFTPLAAAQMRRRLLLLQSHAVAWGRAAGARTQTGHVPHLSRLCT